MSPAAGARPFWLAAARPQTLPVGVAPVMLATALAWASGGVQWAVLVCALGGSVAIQVGTNLFNDWADGQRGTDGADRLGPQRMTQQGLLPAASVLRASLVCFAVATAFGAVLLARGGWVVVAVGSLSVLAGILYTGGPFPLAYHGLGDVFAFVFFGPVPVVTTFYLHRGSVVPEAWAWGMSLGAFSAAVLAVNNLRDRFTDARAHKNTLAVRLGARTSRVGYAALLAFAYLCAAGCGVGAWLRGEAPWQLLTWLSAPWAWRHTAAVFVRDGAALNPLLGATARLEAGFAALACVGRLASMP